MISKITEELATNAVRKSILLCRYLSAYISENDKGPSWDGFIYIYNDARQAKTDYRGRVPVQVKGTFSGDLTRDRIHHTVEISDLKSYARDGGVIYFVVCLGENGYRERIYYSCLTREGIQALLESCTPDQQTKNVEFVPFPLEESKKTEIIRQFENRYRSQPVPVYPRGFSQMNLGSYWSGPDGVISEERIIPILERRGIHILDLHHGNQIPQIVRRLREECCRDVCDVRCDDLVEQIVSIIRRNGDRSNKILKQLFNSCGDILVFRDLDLLAGRAATMELVSELLEDLSASHSVIISGNMLTERIPDFLERVRESEYFRVCR